MSKTIHARITIGFLGLILALLPGCGDKSPRNCNISGTVTIDGVPVKEGMIIFAISDASDLSSGAIIVDGKYQTEVTPGHKVVRITASGGRDGLGEDAVASDLVPAKYRESPPEIDVKRSGVHNFELTTD